MVADARIGADAFAHRFDVGAQQFSEIGQLVHEADTRSEHRVGRVLGQLGAAVVHEHQFFVVAAERRVQLAHLFAGRVIAGANDDPVRAHAIGEGAAFLEEFGVGHHPHLEAAAAAALQFFAGLGGDLIRRADRHRGLDDQGAIGLHVRGDLPGDVEHMGQVGGSVLIGGGAHGDEDQLGMLHCVAGLGAEQQTASLDVFFQCSG